MIRRLAAFGVVAFAILAIVGPWLAPYDPASIDLERQFEAPSWAHPLGTGDNGVDLLSVLLHGARLAGIVGVTVTGFSLVFGGLVGLIAGYLGGWVDHLVTGVADLMQAFPAIVLQVAILALVARPGMVHLIVALSIGGWVLYARVARAEVIAVRERDYVAAARVLGLRPLRILLRHILPNSAGPLVVQVTTGFGATVLAESTLSFLGLGPGGVASWGATLEQGSAVLLRFPHVAVVSGTAIAGTVLAFNLAGDALRDRLDPRR